MYHHARLIVAPHGGVLSEVHEEIGFSDLEALNHPDILSQTYEVFGIVDARSLIERASQKPVSESHRTFICHCGALTVEAQNALLKLLEDPPETARFFFVVSHVDLIIPTLRSRFDDSSSVRVNEEDETLARSFLELPYADRIAEITDHTKEKNLAWIRSLLRGLEILCAAHTKEERQAILKEILFVREHIERRGASSKMLLEHLALLIPQKLSVPK